MTKVTIVSRTCMGPSKVCIGAMTRDDGRNLRLLPAEGVHGWHVDVKYEVGDVWDIEYAPATLIEHPHTEDVIVSETGRPVAEQRGLGDYLAMRVRVWCGPPSELFDRKLVFTRSGRAYLPPGTDAAQSVGFWRPAARLVLDEQKSYRYDAGLPTRYVKYVGSADAVPEVPEGTLVRVSLSRRFVTSSADGCWLQLSGWYPEAPHRPVWRQRGPRASRIRSPSVRTDRTVSLSAAALDGRGRG